MSKRRISFLVPGDWNTPTGGYTYDRRMVQSLEDGGWVVDVYHLPGAWPYPDTGVLSATAAIVASLPDGALVVADGLAFGAMAAVVKKHTPRLRWVALVHHPLHLETGLDETTREQLLVGESSALQSAAQVVVTSHSTVLDVVAMGVPKAHIAVVEPGTDPQALRAGRSVRDSTAVRLLCVATVTPRKGHAVLLQALDGLGHLPWELHNVGSLDRDPALASRLQAMSEEGVLAGRVCWHGAVDDEALQAHYAQADLFVLPSLHEGFGMVVNEAVAHGLPVVTTTAGALAHTLPPGAGLQVPAGNAAALRDALGRLMTEPDLCAQLSAGAQAAAQKLPGWNHQASILADVLEGVA
ncbi:glycosyltransferase family 4 protein [Hydrogenophaga sp.]|uniref:glycosyltransferase family 4 protein n=1 Tax=Hydrogenophaga sp. TaxID=1904254 RepID=UPI0027237534|nr:glycosyltransferase family 4 protein [Hydrogenophaga sp.]MDO8904503.1 glycosyltransferase family 4 protein [Hydrogenophaga sp.]